MSCDHDTPCDVAEIWSHDIRSRGLVHRWCGRAVGRRRWPHSPTMEFFDLPPTRRADLEIGNALFRRLLRSGELVAVQRGIVVGALHLASAVEPRDRHLLAAQIAIASTTGAPTYACLGTAGLLHGFSRLGRTPERVRLYRARGGAWRNDATAVLVCGLPDPHVQTSPFPATTPARTVIDLARWVSFRGGVVVADSAIRLGVSRPELERVAQDCTRWPGICKAREVLAFADGRAESPLESVSRVVFHEMLLPTPELQAVLVRDEFGHPKTIVDFYWEEFRVVGEADGLLKYDDDEEERRSLREEKLRQEELEALGFTVVRWTWDDIWRRPDWVVARLRRAFDTRRRAA